MFMLPTGLHPLHSQDLVRAMQLGLGVSVGINVI